MKKKERIFFIQSTSVSKKGQKKKSGNIGFVDLTIESFVMIGVLPSNHL